MTVKVKYSDFTQATRSKTNALPFAEGGDVFRIAAELLATVYPFKLSVRLLGVTLSSLSKATRDDVGFEKPQLDLNL